MFSAQRWRQLLPLLLVFCLFRSACMYYLLYKQIMHLLANISRFQSLLSMKGLRLANNQAFVSGIVPTQTMWLRRATRGAPLTHSLRKV